MAKFDVDVPQSQDPQFLHYSHPISDIKPDTSAGTFFKGIGDAIEEGVKGLDETFKKHAQFLGEQLGDKEQTDFLNAVKVTDSLTKPQDQTPEAVKQGLDFIKRNQDAYSQGKVRETEYYRNLYEKAKELRTQWPGYRDYIDKGVEKATGITPNANQYIKSLLQDINDRNSKANKYEEHSVSAAFEAMKQGAPEMADHIDAFQKGQMSIQELNRHTNAAMSTHYQARTAEDRLHTLQAGDTTQQMYATNLINQNVSDRLAKMHGGLMVNLGAGPEKVDQIIQDSVEGKRNLSDDDFTRIGMLENQRYMQLRSTIETEHNRVDPQTGRSIKQMMSDKYKSTMDDAFEAHKTFQQAIANHDLGLAFAQKNLNQAQFEGGMYKSLQDPNFRGPALLLKSLHSVGGDSFVPMIYNQLKESGVNITDKNSLSILIGNLAATNKFSLSDVVDKVIEGNNGTPDPKAVDAALKMPAQALLRKDVSDPMKINMIHNIFNDKSKDVLDKINMDGTGKAGRYEAFAYYTSPEAAKEIKRLSANSPALWEQYRQWVEHNFQKNTYGKDLVDLANMQKDPRIEIKLTDSEPPGFVAMRRVTGRTLGGGAEVPINNDAINNIFSRVNKGIRSLYNIYKEDNEQSLVKTRILQVMRSNGISVDEGNSVARAMAIAVGASKKPPNQPTEKDQSKP